MQGEKKNITDTYLRLHHACHSHVVAHRWDLGAVRAAEKQGPDIPCLPFGMRAFGGHRSRKESAAAKRHKR
jgi:hypothetical protein